MRQGSESVSGSGDVFQCQHQYLCGNGDIGWGSDGGGSGSSSGGGGGGGGGGNDDAFDN